MAERRKPNSATRLSRDLFAAVFSVPEAAGARPSACANRFDGRLGRQAVTSISATNSLVTISERRSTIEPDRVAPALSHCSPLNRSTATSSRFFPALSSIAKCDFCNCFRVIAYPLEELTEYCAVNRLGQDRADRRGHDSDSLSLGPHERRLAQVIRKGRGSSQQHPESIPMRFPREILLRYRGMPRGPIRVREFRETIPEPLADFLPCGLERLC